MDVTDKILVECMPSGAAETSPPHRQRSPNGCRNRHPEQTSGTDLRFRPSEEDNHNYTYSFEETCDISTRCRNGTPEISRRSKDEIDDPRPAAGSYSMADVRWLSAPVIRLRDMLEGVLVLSGLSRVWKNRVCDPLWRLPFYCTPHAATDVVIPDPTMEDLVVGTPSAKILAKAEASQKRKVPPRAIDDDGDACVEIPLVTPIRSAAVIPSSGNQGGRSLVAEGPSTRDSRGKGIMVDNVVAPSASASRPKPSSGFVPSFRDVFGDAIHANFFPFSVGSYYATYPEGGVAENYEFTRKEWDAPYRPTFGVLTKEVFKDPAVCKTVVDKFPTPREMVLVESLSDDQLTTKMSVLHCLMMSHGGELFAQYHGLLQSHHKHVFGLNDKLSSFDASFAKFKAKRKEGKKKIKSFTKSLDNLHAEVARLSADLNRATILEAEKDEEILRLKTTPPELASFFRGHDGFERGLSMHQTKDEFADALKKMAHFVPGAQVNEARGAKDTLGILFWGGAAPTISIDNITSFQLYLSKYSIKSFITTAKSSEVNVMVPVEDPDADMVCIYVTQKSFFSVSL
ncbi:ycf3-interacting protein 1, chloroplastic [Tanacetum coccineum]|uniref:Ycf3-interacting protein 1, chloroplastic n=1 Tax=Tanacetum coccineum TaxID=301880 RepID=A0ABQ5ACR0_9ASTR